MRTWVGPGIGSEFGLSRRGGYQIQRRKEHGLSRDDAIFTSNGRAALSLAIRCIQHLNHSQRNMVLLPAYLCDSIIQPFVEQGVQVCFYPVGSKLTVHLSEVLERVNDQTLAILLVNYFGFGQHDNLVNHLAQELPDVAVIDDRSHLLLSDLFNEVPLTDKVIRIYSARKWGAFPDLGILTWSHPKDSDSSYAHFIGKGYDWAFGLYRFLGMCLRALFFAWPAKGVGHASLWFAQHGELILDHRIQVKRASPISRWLWHFWNWETAWHIRRENYQYLLDNWSSKEITPLFETLPTSVCPLGFPIRSTERDRLRSWLISQRIYPPIHWLRSCYVSPSEFPEAATLAEQELTLPIDQRYGLQHMDYILEAMSHV